MSSPTSSRSSATSTMRSSSPSSCRRSGSNGSRRYGDSSAGVGEYLNRNRRSRVRCSTSAAASNVRKHTVERPRHLGRIQRVDEQPCVSDLPSAAAAHEAAKLLMVRPSLPRRLFLQRAEGSQVTVSREDLFHRGGSESANELVLQVCHA